MKRVLVLLSCIALGLAAHSGRGAVGQNPTQVPVGFSRCLVSQGNSPSAPSPAADFRVFVTGSRYITVSSAADFAPATVTVVEGVLKAGDASSVAAEDGVALKIKSVMLDGSFGDIVQYDFSTTFMPSTPAIGFNVIQRVTVAPQQEQLSLYNFSTGTFDILAVGTLSIPVSTTTTLNITNPVPYISSSGQVQLQVRVGDSGTTRWKHLIDQVNLTAGPNTN